MPHDAPQPAEPNDGKQSADTWPVPDYKYGMPFKIFARDVTAEDIYAWFQEQRRKAGHADEPPRDSLPPS